ncbi:hypothetical protein WA556_000444, partial [Blastocystis sp. ATCC 50177/Nand II]
MPFLRRITRRQYFLYQYVLALLAGIGAIALEFAPTHPMQFLEGDMIISHTCGNTVSTAMVTVYYILVLLALVFAVLVFIAPEKKLHYIHYVSIIGVRILVNVLLSVCILKVFVGKPRPCFFDKCGYPITDNVAHLYGLVGVEGDISKCTASRFKINDAMRSFPSGHSAVASAALCLVCIVLSSLVSECTKWRRVTTERVYVISAAIVLGISLFITASRVTDYLHFVEDTIAGFLIGVAVAIATNNSMQTLFLYTTDPSNATQMVDVESQEDSPSASSGFIKRYMFQSAP